MTKRKKIVILGSTGSIGVSALDVIGHHPDRFEVLALVAGSNVEALAGQIQKFRPRVAVMREKASAELLKTALGAKSETKILWGDEESVAAATLPEADIVLSAIVGAAGLKPTYAALKAGKTVALANKESLVAAGPVMTQALKEGKGMLIPVDSEHSAIHQVLHGSDKEVLRIILTASGGPFRTWSAEQIAKATLDEALQHPKWKMGAKITIDSATMMNKGLEIIEAHWLFALPSEKIAVKVHPQSIIHSLVEYVDGSVLAQLGNPDMRTPIVYALAYPERITTNVEPLDLVKMSPLSFEEPDPVRFPALSLARQALEMGGSAPCSLNAANEVAVEAFLQKKVSFMDIAHIVGKVLATHRSYPLHSLEDVLEADTSARKEAQTFIKEI
ncbi:MAG: 1-deoxy-D-xylulose-5-phosphate reductoisomerase [Deltaproteobacteria bacterium]|nr:1-deoxy-D-xylulose-5-phosphate reductoisomerase [Deltaproteobacteria bacterium]